jgi:WD40 repeat protein
MSRCQVFRIMLTLLLLAGRAGAAASAPTAELPILRLDPGGHTARVTQVLFTPDGREVFSVGEDKVIRSWEVASWWAATLRPIPALAKGIGAPEGHTFRPYVGRGHDGMIYAAALSPDAKTLAIGGFLDAEGKESKRLWGDIRLCDVATGQLVRTLRGHASAVLALAFSPDGSTLASGSADGTVRLWQVATGAPTLLGKHEKEVTGVAFAPDGRRLASSGGDRAVRVWNLRERRQERELRKHEDGVTCVAWSPDGRTIASGSLDSTLRLWDAETGILRKSLPHDDFVNCIAFRRDGAILSGTGSGKRGDLVVRLWSPEGTWQRDFAVRGVADNTVMSVAVSPDPKHPTLAFTDARGTIYLWDAENDGPKLLRGTGASVASVAWSPDGKRVSWGSDEQHPREHVFNLAAGVPEAAAADGERWQGGLSRSDGRELIRADDRVRVVVRVGTRELARLPRNPAPDDEVRCCAFTPAGDVVIGTLFALAQYDLSGKLIRHFDGHTGAVLDVAVSPDGRYLASASSDQTVKIWRLTDRDGGQSAEPVLSLFGGADQEWVAWTPDGYYNCSPRGERIIGWHVNQGRGEAAKYYPAYQFRDRFYQPELIRQRFLGGAPAGDAAQSAREVARSEPPRVEILSPNDGTVTSPEVTVRARVVDPNDHKLTKVTLRIAARSGGLVLVQEKGGSEWSQPATLRPGENLISVVAVNDQGTESLPTQVSVTYQPPVGAPDAPKKPTLYLLAIGVSQYADPRIPSLHFAAKDAEDFTAFYRAQEGRLFGRVEVQMLTDAQATREKILGGLDWLKQRVSPGDTVVVFASGHGMMAPQAGDASHEEYCFAPHDTAMERLEKSTVGWSAFRATLAGLPATVLLVLDTCHAGGGSDLATRRVYNDALREAMTDNVGIITFASCMPYENSAELNGNGAFTRALLEALTDKGDYTHDGKVILPEAEAYVALRVEELTGGRQHPTMGRPTSIPSSLTLALVGSAP